MRGLVLRELGGPDAAEIADMPEPEGAHPMADGQRVLVEVHAAGVSFPDLLRSRGEYQMRPELPFVTGAEVAGIVREADPATGFAAGERVAALLRA
jgi:NADPH2:quinone reductase